MLGQTGFRLFSAPTFMPAWLFLLSGSEFVVGLARSLQALGEVLSPMLGASLIGHRGRTLKINLIAGAAMRLQILLVALSGLLLGSSEAGIYAVIFFLTLLGFFQGIQGVLMNSLRAKVIPVGRRGFVTGWRNFLAGGTTALLSYFVGGWFIDEQVFGDGYAALFLLAFVITSLGLAALAFTREPEAVTVRQRSNFLESFQALPDLLRGNPAFARFFLVRALGSFGRMAMPFYILYAATQFEMSGAILGVLTTLWMLTGTATNVIWGGIADRRGYRIVMVLTLAIWIIAHVELLVGEGVGAVMIFFVLVGTASGGFNQASQNLVMEMGNNADIPLRLAVSNMAVNMVGMVGPLLGGIIAMVSGYAVIFVICIVMQMIALGILIGWVPEPRHATRRG
jgi:MFS family permease